MEESEVKAEFSDIECRACSRKMETCLGEQELRKTSKIYTELTSIKIPSNDHLPVTFCDLCRSRLSEFEAFKRLCEQTYRLFCVRRKEHTDFEIYSVKSEDNASSRPPSPEFFACDMCEEKFSSRRTLKSHLIGEHMSLSVRIVPDKKKALRCPRDGCEKKFNREDRLQAHLRVHDGKKPEVCPICSMELKTLRILKRHLETHNTERNQKCSYCEKAFKTKAQLEVHERYIHRKERAFVCNQCGAVFYNPTGLCTHVYNKHNPEKKFQCDECPRAFKNSFDLRDHKIRHKGTREHVCNKCDKTFVTNKDLKKHDRENHSSIDRSAQCEVCSMILKDKKTLKQHMFTHTGERPFKCSFCPKAFTIKKALERHMTTHTGIRPFKCSFCAKTFAERFYMNKHIERSHGVNPNALNTGVQDRRFLSKLGPEGSSNLNLVETNGEDV